MFALSSARAAEAKRTPALGLAARNGARFEPHSGLRRARELFGLGAQSLP